MYANRFSGLLVLVVLAAGCGDSLPEPPRLLPGPPLHSANRPEGVPIRLASVSANVLRTNREVRPILRYLEEGLGRRFELLYCRSYRDMEEAVKEGRCELAWLSAQMYLTLRASTGCEPIAQYLLHGKPSYRGVLISIVADSLDALKGKRLALVDRNSTSGYAYPLLFFKNRGIDPASHFAQLTFAGTHENAAMSVLRGQADAACIEEPVLARLQTKVDIKPLRVIAVIGEMPNGPIVAQASLPAGLRDKISRALIELGSSPAGRPIVDGLRSESDFTGFGPVTDATYDEVRRARAAAGLN